MKNRKKIISVLAVLTLMVSTMVLFTGCNQFYKKKLVGVWEVKKEVDKDGKNLLAFLALMGTDIKPYAYFTDDGKYGIVVKGKVGIVSGIFKANETNYEFNNPKLTIKSGSTSYTVDCEFSGNKLILKGKIDGNTEGTIELEKASSPSLDECKNARKLPLPNIGG